MTHAPGEDENLFRTVYASRAALSIMPHFSRAVTEIVATSQVNNARRGVTGLLLGHNGWFMQVLEGAPADVADAVKVIAADKRHGQYHTLLAEPTNSRLFGRWTMCARSLTPDAEPVLAELELNPDFNPFRMRGDRALRLLMHLGQFTDAPLARQARVA